MKFSVIVPIYNVEKYIAECIDSVLSQTYDNFELILVDDGSLDNCPKICNEYAQNDDRIKVIHKENAGVVKARQTGLDLAIGEYVIMIDGDDFVQKDMLQELSKCISSNNFPDLICFDYNVFGNGILKMVSCGFSQGYYDREQIKQQIFPCLVRGENGTYFSPTVWGKAFKRKYISKYHSIVDPMIKIGEDGCVVIPYIYYAQSMYIEKKAMYNYRYNPTSVTKKRDKGFPWVDVELCISHLKKLLPEQEPLFYQQLCRYVTHALFNISKSWLQTDKKYRDVKKEIKEQLSSRIFQPYIKGCKFKHNFKEGVAAFLVKHRCVWGIKIIAIYEQKLSK